MKNRLLNGLLVFLTVLFAGFAQAQDITGTVSDNSGPLPGASVVVKGTTNSASTDLNGKYAIKNAGANAVLVFSYIGLASTEVAVAGKSVVNVVLKDDQEKLKEVVVIGYGSVKKKDATGAVDQLSSKKFDNIAATSPAEILRGKVAGVQVTSSSGEPGAATSIRIRGNGSIRSGNGPLIVVDGVPLAGGDVTSGGADINLGSSSAKNPLSFINQNDIESMSILKDASSTAIYGARGANGVIIITTKKGKSKTPELSYNTSFQSSKFESDFDVLNGDRFASVAPAGSDKGSRNYNWKDLILQTGLTVSNDLSYASSTENSNTRVSFGAANSTGIVKNTGMDKYTATLSNSSDFLNGILKVDSRISYSNIKDQRTLITNNTGYIGNLLSSALYWNPTRSTRAADGSYTFVGDDYINPEHLLNSYSGNSDLGKLFGNINASVKFSKNFKYNLLVGIETSNGVTTSQINPDIVIKDVATATNPANLQTYRGQATINSDQRLNKTIEHNLTITKDFSENFNLNAILGYSYYDYRGNGSFTTGKGYAPTQRNLVDNIEGGVSSEYKTTSYRGREELQSVFARTSFALYNKLNLDLTVRRDGSSKPSLDNKYQNFYSAGIGYKLIQNKNGILNDFKIRGNFGTTGNAEFNRNSSIGVIEYTSPIDINFINNANTKLKWETTTSSGVGADFTLVNNRLSGSFDYFKRDTKDLILGIPSASGQPSPQGIKYTNIDGVLSNTGYELGLNLKAIDKEDLSWDISANMAILSNNISGLGDKTYDAGAVNGQGLSDAFVQTIKNDYPIYTYSVLDFQGYDAGGISQYKNPDGSIVGSAAAKKVVTDKQALPKMTIGFSTSLTVKNFDFSTSFYGAFGHYLYNNTDNALFYAGALGLRNSTENVVNSGQNASDANSPSTKYLEKGDFLRMGNLTLGYNFKSAILEHVNIKALRFYVSGSNLLLITNYSGFDPEVDTDKTFKGIPSAGIDYFSYPKAKTFAVGLNVTF
jgi:TonB-dependent starch-binding outer membrane protein SusC